MCVCVCGGGGGGLSWLGPFSVHLEMGNTTGPDKTIFASPKTARGYTLLF